MADGITEIGTSAPFPMWMVDLDVERRGICLSPAEHDRARRFRAPVQARRYIHAHMALREMADRHFAPGALFDWHVDRLGKPRFADLPELHFSLSYSGQHALIAIAEGQVVGIDIERLRHIPDAQAVARSCFSPSETRELDDSAPADLARRFLLGWTRKEAYLKLTGSGFTLPPESVTVGLTEKPAQVNIDGVAAATVCSFIHADMVGAYACFNQ